MNYALDALWWRLADPAVRDLAVLLTSPPPWHSGSELPVRSLLGEQGFRYLLALDAAPQPLYAAVHDEAPFGHRLGVYAEALLAFWLAHAPHCRLHARNLPFRRADGCTAGAADFIADINGVCHHIELTCKYYGGADTAVLCGLNRADTLHGKATKLGEQLAQVSTPAFQAALHAAGVPAVDTSVSVVRGMLFLPPDTDAVAAPLNRYGWQGLWGEDWAALAAAAGGEQVRYAPIPRMALLAPQRLPENRTFALEALMAEPQGIAAVLQRRPDGHWHEIRRLMRA